MSDIQDLIHRNAMLAFDQGAKQERRNLLEALERYLNLTCEPDERGRVTDNPEWDNGFQAAMAIIKGEQK